MHVETLYRRICLSRVASRSWRVQRCKAVHSHQPRLSQVVFPHSDSWSIEGVHATSSQLIDMLAPSVTEDRITKMRQVIASRTYSVVPVVEGLYDMGNLAAVCRSADAMGFGAVHCIMRPTDKYKKSQRTAAGADKWLDTKLWDSTADCLESLKQAGYQIVVTHLSASSITTQEVDWTRPTAFVLGNERSGVSDTAVSVADHTAVIPMAGFVESYNISVAAALIMYEAQQQRIRQLGRSGDLTEQQKEQLLASFLLRGVKNSRMMVGELLHRPPPAHQKKYFKNVEQTVMQQQHQDVEQQQQLQQQVVSIESQAAATAGMQSHEQISSRGDMTGNPSKQSMPPSSTAAPAA